MHDLETLNTMQGNTAGPPEMAHSLFLRESELPQVGFKPTSLYSLDQCSVHCCCGGSVVVGQIRQYKARQEVSISNHLINRETSNLTQPTPLMLRLSNPVYQGRDAICLV